MGKSKLNTTRSLEESELILECTPELRQNQHEQDESSGQNCNHKELIELLMFMLQEMKARDDQLRT